LLIRQDFERAKICLSGWNGVTTFAVESNVYVGLGQLQAIATTFEGSPVDRFDACEIMLGALGSDYVDGIRTAGVPAASIVAIAFLSFTGSSGRVYLDATRKLQRVGVPPESNWQIQV